jgi:hypothetical protein
MRESDIEDYLVKRVKALGGEVRKVKWIGRNGAPDRLVMLPVVDRGDEVIIPGTVWIELKAPGLAALFPHTPHERQQHREHERMRKMGQRVEVVDSFVGIDEALQGLMCE